MSPLFRGVFWLLVVVIITHVLVVLGGVTACIIYAADIVAGRFECDKSERMMTLLASALATVTAILAMLLQHKDR